MVARIWIYRQCRVKIMLGNLYYYLSVVPPFHVDYSNVLRWIIVKNTCSKKDWMQGCNSEQIDYIIRPLSLKEIYRVLFIGAPENEKEVRKIEYLTSLNLYFQDLSVSVFWCPNMSSLMIGRFTINFRGELPRRNKHKRIDILKWFKRLEYCEDDERYPSLLLKNVSIPFFDLMWFLNEEGYVKDLDNMLDEML